MDDNATSEYEAEALSWSSRLSQASLSCTRLPDTALERILSTACETHEQIDDVLRRLLDLFAQCTGQSLLPTVDYLC